MLPTKLKHSLFDRISAVTMRPFFHPQPYRAAGGLVKEVLAQSQGDFFINGTITCHWACPELMAGIWVGGREAVLVDDRLPAWLKIAMGASLSRANRCPYCEDMLLSLTHGAREHNVAGSLRDGRVDAVRDPLVRRRLAWAQYGARPDEAPVGDAPFDPYELPEALATLLVFGYTNRVSDYALDGSPVPKTGRGVSLKLFGVELRESAARRLAPGASLDLLAGGSPPVELRWAWGHPRINDALARWYHAVENAAAHVLAGGTREYVLSNLAGWNGGAPPLSRSWVEQEVQPLRGAQRDIARLLLLVAKASYQVDDGVLERVARHGVDEAGLVSLGAWAAFRGANRTVSLLSAAAEGAGQPDIPEAELCACA